jgi:hypothetical protein
VIETGTVWVFVKSSGDPAPRLTDVGLTVLSYTRSSSDSSTRYPRRRLFVPARSWVKVSKRRMAQHLCAKARAVLGTIRSISPVVYPDRARAYERHPTLRVSRTGVIDRERPSTYVNQGDYTGLVHMKFTRNKAKVETAPLFLVNRAGRIVSRSGRVNRTSSGKGDGTWLQVPEPVLNQPNHNQNLDPDPDLDPDLNPTHHPAAHRCVVLSPVPREEDCDQDHDQDQEEVVAARH